MDEDGSCIESHSSPSMFFQGQGWPYEYRIIYIYICIYIYILHTDTASSPGTYRNDSCTYWKLLKFGMSPMEPRTWHQVFGTKYLVPITGYQVLAISILVPSTWYMCLVPSTWFQYRTEQWGMAGRGGKCGSTETKGVLTRANFICARASRAAGWPGPSAGRRHSFHIYTYIIYIHIYIYHSQARWSRQPWSEKLESPMQS